MSDDDRPRGFRVEVLLRAARHHADLSQRELADKAGFDRKVVSRIESGMVTSPQLYTVLRLLTAAGVHLVAVTAEGDLLADRPYEDALDAAGRHWPAHLEVREVHCLNDWWKGKFLTDLRPLPPFTADWRRNWGRRRRPKAPVSRRGTAP